MFLRIYIKAFCFALIVSILSASNRAQQPPNSAASIDSAFRSVVYVGGDILTMRGTSPEYVEGLAIKDGKILFAGPRLEAQRLAGPDAKIVDLGGKTLLPGFIDTHGHFVYFGKNLVDANLFNCQSIEELISRMKKQAEVTPEGAWIVGFGYQARTLKEGRPPTAEELAQISSDRPVMIVDSSGHLGAAN
ncbi:MAG: amidohydrolase family protein, partial [Planctomycetota bacterium]|nr:amidohydrolase family protein [Planctomycetota bacterium]